MRRTVRFALWTGEEEGLLGSRAYVKEHFGDRQSMELKPDHAKVSAYFNVDNGTVKFAASICRATSGRLSSKNGWSLQIHGHDTLSARGTAAPNHVSFDEVGLPGFQFIQDPIEYDSRRINKYGCV